MRYRWISLVCAGVLGLPGAAAALGGTVVDDQGRPVPGARVRVSPNVPVPPTSELVVETNEQGMFTFDSVPAGSALLTVGAIGYLTLDGGVTATGQYEIPLDPLFVADNSNYSWIKPSVPAGSQELSCDLCHGEQTTQWAGSWHAQAATNPKVLDLYNGTGGGSGPDYRNNNPNEAGPCANCHAAAAAVGAVNDVELHQVSGVPQNGVFCEVCHKVREVDDPSRAGVDGALKIWRPPFAAQFAFGPYDDSKTHNMLSSYNPLFRSSRLCAGCHEWMMDTPDGGQVPVMTTFSEWARLGDPVRSQQCQDCHMRAFYREEPDPMNCEGLTPASPEPNGCAVSDPHVQQMGARRRDSSTISRHRFEGATDEYLRKTFEVGVELDQEGDELVVAIDLRNQFAGHAVPTGMPFREVLLTVDAVDGNGTPLVLQNGPALSDAAGDLAGRAGLRFARVLGDAAGNADVPFWRATKVVSDNRLLPGGKMRTEHRFKMGEPGTTTVDVRLTHRRFSATLAGPKGWDTTDSEMFASSDSIDLEEIEQGGCSAFEASAASLWLLGLPLLALRRCRRKAGHA